MPIINGAVLVVLKEFMSQIWTSQLDPFPEAWMLQKDESRLSGTESIAVATTWQQSGTIPKVMPIAFRLPVKTGTQFR